MADERSNRKMLVHQVEKLQKVIVEKDLMIQKMAEEIKMLKAGDKQAKKSPKYGAGGVF